MNIKLINGFGAVDFSDLKEGELFVGELDGKPYNRAFNVKIPMTKNDFNINCNAFEYAISNSNHNGRLVAYGPANKVYRVKIDNVELSLL